MSQLNYMQVYGTQVFRQKFGNRLEIVRGEKRKERAGQLELTVFRVIEKPLYDLSISFSGNNRDEDGYVIRNITSKEMLALCESFNKLYNKMKGKKK